MLPELFSNNFITHLTQDVLIGDSVIHVNDVAPAELQGPGQFHVTIGAESMAVVGAQSTNTWNVQRGVESAAAAHSTNDLVIHGPTAGVMRMLAQNNTVPSIEAYGHSWINDSGATNARYGFVERLANMLGKATVNKVGMNGAVVANVAASGGVGSLLQSGLATDLTAGPYITRGGLKVCAIGLNDYALYNAVTNGNLLVENCLALAYSRLIAARVVNALSAGPALNSGELTYTGAWTAQADTTVSPGLGRTYTSTNGDSVTLVTDAAYQGEAINVIIPLSPTYTSTLTVTVDGGASIASLSTVNFAAALSAAGVASAAAGLRIPAGTIAAGAHSVKVAMTAISGYAFFAGIVVESSAPPPLIVPSYPLESGDPGPSNTKAAWSNTRNQNAIAAFTSGVYVDLNPAMSPNYPSSIDLVNWSTAQVGHPNNLGYGRIAALLQPIIRGLLTPAVAAAMN